MNDYNRSVINPELIINMSRYLPYIIGQNHQIDCIITKVISQMGLELEEVHISKLEPSRYSGCYNIGIFLFNIEKVNHQYTGQWILKIESLTVDDDAKDQDGNVLSNNNSLLWWENKGLIVCNSKQNSDNCLLDTDTIEEINVLQDRLNLFKQSEIIQDILIIPIAIGEEKNDKELIGYSLRPKADGRTLSDILQSHTSKLTRPSFWEFDSYESYLAEIEARFEESGAAITTDEIKDIYYRIGKSLAKLHLSEMLQESNAELSFSSSCVHGDFHAGNILISAYTVQFIDNDLILIEPGDVGGEPISKDVGYLLTDLLWYNPYDNYSDICKYLESFFKGYISIYNDKVTIAEYFKSWITTYYFPFCTEHAGWIKDSASDIQDIVDQLPNIIDSIVANERSDDRCDIGNLLGDSFNEAIVNE